MIEYKSLLIFLLNDVVYKVFEVVHQAACGEKSETINIRPQNNFDRGSVSQSQMGMISRKSANIGSPDNDYKDNNGGTEKRMRQSRDSSMGKSLKGLAFANQLLKKQAKNEDQELNLFLDKDSRDPQMISKLANPDD